MGIPIGEKISVTVSGSKTKLVECEKCAEGYIYRADRTAKGESSNLGWIDRAGASNRAEASAKNSLEKALDKAVDAVACPKCGWFQSDMVRVLRGDALMWSVVPLSMIAISWGFIAVIADTSVVWPGLLFLSGGAVTGFLFKKDYNVGYELGPGHPQRAEASRGVLVSVIEEQQNAENAELQQHLYEVLRLAMIAMAGIDGSVDPEEIMTVAGIYTRFSDEEIDLSELHMEAERAIGHHEDILSELRELEPHLQMDGKKLFMRAVLYVAAADEHFDDAEWDLVSQIGSVLKMTVPEIQAEVDDVLSRESDDGDDDKEAQSS